MRNLPAILTLLSASYGALHFVRLRSPGGMRFMMVRILAGEPPGLAAGRVLLEDGSEVFGVLAEPYLVEGRREITAHGGWRAYLQGQ